jgi:hypothetical protein
MFLTPLWRDGELTRIGPRRILEANFTSASSPAGNRSVESEDDLFLGEKDLGRLL